LIFLTKYIQNIEHAFLHLLNTKRKQLEKFQTELRDLREPLEVLGEALHILKDVDPSQKDLDDYFRDKEVGTSLWSFKSSFTTISFSGTRDDNFL